jgi:uncharacterized protein (DUF1501 family)
MHMSNVNRRVFLKQGALSFIALGSGPFWGPQFLRQAAWAADLGASATKDKVLVVIFQRGAVDGLSMVVPYGDPSYYQNRQEISLAAPSQAAGENGVLDLDGYFGLHPSLSALLPLYKAGHLAPIQACGSPNASRSHFDSQDLMESGVDEDKSVQEGWLNRLMGCCPEDAAKQTAFRAVSMTSVIPRSLQGPQDAMAIRDLDTFGMAGDIVIPVSGGGSADGFESMYSGAVDTVLHGEGAESFDALSLLKQARSTAYVPANGATYPDGGLGKNLRQVAQLIKANVGVQIAFAEMDGWDTHANQGNAKGQLATRLKIFGDSLAAFYQDMGDKMRDVVVVTQSEFGRTVKQNGNRGTDHGHATCFFTLGGSVKGGKVYGDWPTLAPDKLFQNRDLAITTDFRDVFGEIVSRHFNIPMNDMAALFPHYQVDAANFRRFYAA